jgi:hypothetical protein
MQNAKLKKRREWCRVGISPSKDEINKKEE